MSVVVKSTEFNYKDPNDSTHYIGVGVISERKASEIAKSIAEAGLKVAETIPDDYSVFYSHVETNTIVDANWSNDGWIAANGSINSSETSFHYTDPIPVEDLPIALRIISNVGATNSMLRIHAYDSNGTWLRQLIAFQITSLNGVDAMLNVSASDIHSIRISAKKDIVTEPVIVYDESIADSIEDLRDIICTKTTIETLWQAGGLYNDSGAEYSATDRLRTIFIPENCIGMYVPNGYSVSFRAYNDDGTYISTISGLYGTWYTNGYINFKAFPKHKYRVVLKNDINSTIDLDESKAIIFKIAKNTKVIHIGQGYEYTTLRSGIEEAIKTNGTRVIVHPGTYDLCTEFASEIAASGTNVLFGIKLENDVHVTFLPGAYVKALYSTTGENIDPNIQKCFNPFCAGTNGGYILEGLDIEAGYTRYCLHEENGPGTTPRFVHIKDCRMVLTSGTSTGYVQCIGGGFGKHDHITIENCYFENASYAQSAVSILTYHNAFNYSDAASKLFIRNCYCAKTGRMSFRYAGTSTQKTYVTVSGCSLGNEITHGPENSSQTVDNVEIISYCNEIRS